MTGTESKLRAEQALVVCVGVGWWWWSDCDVGRAGGRGCWRDWDRSWAVGDVLKERLGETRAVLLELQARILRGLGGVAGVGGEVFRNGRSWVGGGMKEGILFPGEEPAVLSWWSGIGSGHE